MKTLSFSSVVATSNDYFSMGAIFTFLCKLRDKTVRYISCYLIQIDARRKQLLKRKINGFLKVYNAVQVE